MVKTFAAGLCALALLFTTTDASAIDVVNEDQIDYKVKIKSRNTTKHMDVTAHSYSIVVCVGKCSFYVPGVGRVKATGSDTVTIKNGRIILTKAGQVAKR